MCTVKTGNQKQNENGKWHERQIVIITAVTGPGSRHQRQQWPPLQQIRCSQSPFRYGSEPQPIITCRRRPLLMLRFTLCHWTGQIIAKKLALGFVHLDGPRMTICQCGYMYIKYESELATLGVAGSSHRIALGLSHTHTNTRAHTMWPTEMDRREGLIVDGANRRLTHSLSLTTRVTK